MKRKKTCFAVIDPGSYEMSAIAARWKTSGDYVIEGFARGDSHGIRKGIVTDIPSATDSISAILSKLAERTKSSINEVYAGISSPSVGVLPSSGMVLLSKYGREVTEKDVEECVKVGSALKLPLDIEPLHKIVKDFQIDGESGVRDPLNLDGVKLGVDVNVVTINSSAIRNFSRCIAEAGFLPSGFVFSGLALAFRMLPEENRQKGTALIDICKDLTGAMVYNEGILSGCKAFSMGMKDVILPGGAVDESRVDMIVSKVRSLDGGNKVSDVFVAGDGALNDALMECFEKMFKCPVKAAVCIVKPFEELPAESIAYAGSLGILDYLQQKKHKEKISKNIFRRWYNRSTRFVDKYF